MSCDEFTQFRNAHSHDRRCAGVCWQFIDGLWNKATSDLGNLVEVTDEGSAHLSGIHEINGERALVWMIYPGSGTTGDYPRFELHFKSLRELVPLDEATKRIEEAAQELSKVVSWRPYIKAQNNTRWNLRLGGFRAEHAVSCAVRAIEALISDSSAPGDR